MAPWAGTTSRALGRARSARRLTSSQDEAALGERRQRILEPAEVAAQQQVERAAFRPARPDPAAQDRRAGALLRLGEQVEQDGQLRLVVEVARDHGQRVGVQRGQELLLAQAEHLLEVLGGRAQNSWFSPPNTSDTESSVKMRRIESVSRSAQDSTRMFDGAPGRIGIVSVTTTSSNGAAARFSQALPENTPWVAHAYTERAPSSLTVSAAARSVPAVSIRSSTITAVLSFTSPITYAISATCCAGRSLFRIASSAPTFSANFFASFTRPASGETTTMSSRRRSRKYWVRMNIAVMWSTGFWKKPCTWPAWRSIVSTRSAPALSSMRATRRAVIGSRGVDFLSWRE